MSSTTYLAILAAIVLAVPVSQAIWIPLTHLRFFLYHRSRGSASPSLGLAGTLGYYRRAIAANVVMAWWAVRAWGRNGLRQPPGEVTGPPACRGPACGGPVLCVHGFLRNGTCMWGLRRACERRGRPTRAVSMGLPGRAIERYAPRLEAALGELVASNPDQAIDIVAHSMGGVVLRVVLAEHPRLAGSVGRIVTLGSPHRGTAATRGAQLLPESWQMAPGSAFLESLPDFRTSAPGAEVITIAAERDFMVYPGSTSHLPGSRAVDFPHASHPGLVTDREVIDFVAALLS